MEFSRHDCVSPVALRPPETVMRLKRLGSLHQCRLSFTRTLLRTLKNERWRFERPTFQIDGNGVGHAVYIAHGPLRSYALVCFAHDLDASDRSDRVIAEAWDATFALFDGIPTDGDIERLSRSVPKQEAARISASELSLARANRSVRLFEHVVERLSRGRQPDIEQLESVGYLMRTTAVYGSGKFGAADREVIANRNEFAGSFQPEMLCVYLIRSFTFDLAEHLARARAPGTAVGLDINAIRCLGVGNSTGLGLAPFVVNHPVLLHQWIVARETALARVRSLATAPAKQRHQFEDLLGRAQINAQQWHSADPVSQQKLASLRNDLQAVTAHVATTGLASHQPWDQLYQWAQRHLSLEGQEQLVSLMIDISGDLVNDLTAQMSADEQGVFYIDGAMTLGKLKSTIETLYRWALSVDWQQQGNVQRVWYLSQEKLEPRLGDRFAEPFAAYEQPLAPARDVAALHHDIAKHGDDSSVADFLLDHSEHRHSVRRVQIAANFPYAEIRDNTIAADLYPIDLLRLKLAFFGATRFDPRSDRWVRINLFQGAPLPETLGQHGDDWSYPRSFDAVQSCSR